MSEIFLKLVNMSITASWLVLAVVVLRLVFKKAPKFIHCIMWALVGIRLVLPFSIESIFSLIPSAQTIPNELLTENSFDINTGINFVDDRVNDYLGSHYYEGVTVPTDNGYDVMSILAVVWLVGIAAMLVYTLVSYLRIYKRVSASICVKENTFICDDIDTPFILGVFRPKIYLPSSMSEADAEYVIAHEKAHLKRFDHLWKPLGFSLLAVYWFNPVLWLAYFLLCRDIEFACDQKVIRELGLEIKKPYSDALINCSVPRKMLAACPLAFGETSVKSRIKSVLSFKKPAVWIIIAAALAVSVAAVCLLTNPAQDAKIPAAFYQSDKAEEYGEYSGIGVTLGSDNTCEISFSMTGDFFYGSYKIDKNTLVCSLNKLVGEYINDLEIDIEYHFDILDDDSLRFKKVVGKVGKYYSKIDNTEYDFESQLSHFAKGDTFTPQKASTDGDTTTSSGISGGEENVNASFNATVLEVYENSILVEPDKDSNERKSSDKISVSKKVISKIPVPNLVVGSKINIVYDGMILETYPSQINNVFAIYLVGAGSEDVVYKLSYANYSDNDKLYMTALNKDRFRLNNIEYLPIHKVDDLETLNDFKKDFGSILTLDSGYNEVPSFNDVTKDYNQEFFKDNSLLLVYVPANSCTWRYGVYSIDYREHYICVTVTRTDNSETGDTAMAGWFISVPIDKAKFDEYTEFNSYMVERNPISLNSNDIAKITTGTTPKDKLYEKTITSAKTIEDFCEFVNNLLLVPRDKDDGTSGFPIDITLHYKDGKTDKMRINDGISLNSIRWQYFDSESDGQIQKILFGAYEINKAETYSELTDKKITAVHILRKEKPIVNGQYQEKFVVAKSYTKDIPNLLKNFLNTNHCEEKDANNWVKLVAGWPEKYAVVACLEDNTTMILTVHFDKGDSRNYIAITTLNEQFVVEEKAPEYLEHGYKRYIASEDFGKFILSILE